MCVFFKYSNRYMLIIIIVWIGVSVISDSKQNIS